MHTLYPELRPFATHTLAVDTQHTLYIEQCGSPGGFPVLVIHGGPGAGSSINSRRFFNPEKYHIIIYDQRGSGKSTPYGELENNTTQTLLDDIETIRTHFNIDKWLLFGGSWGSTLALLYAQAHPDRVAAMILRGIFLGRQRDLDWLYREGANRIFPDAWKAFIRPLPTPLPEDLLSAYQNLLNSSNDFTRIAAAKAWATWEASCATLKPNPGVMHAFTDPHTAVSLARIEAHYFINRCFIAENQIIDNMASIKEIPGVIVHGRYDMVCALDNATALNAAWPNSELNIIREAGHSSSEPGITDALVRAANEMEKFLSS